MFRRRLHLPGMLAVLIALVSQLALGSLVLPDDPVAVQSVSILCSGGDPPGQGDTAPHRHHAAELIVCPLSVTLALPGIILTPSPMVPPPSLQPAFRTAERPPGRGPPPPTARVGAPRAPPVLA